MNILSLWFWDRLAIRLLQPRTSDSLEGLDRSSYSNTRASVVITFTLFYQASYYLSDAHGIVKMHILITTLFGEQNNVKCISVLQQRFLKRPDLDKLKPTIRIANGLVQLLLILTTTYQNECHTCSSMKSSARSRHRFKASNTKIFIPTTSSVSFS